MATYAELAEAVNHPGLNVQIAVACYVAAELIRLEAIDTPNHTNRALWAKGVFENPQPVANAMVRAVLAQNRAATVAQITGATDTTVQTAVNNAVNTLATGS